MINQDILTYIQTEQAKGLSPDDISRALASAGWRQADIAAAFSSLTSMSGNSAQVALGSSNIATETTYPITILWLFKYPIVALLLGFLNPVFWLAGIISLVAYFFIRRNFHYSIEDKYFIISQGVFSKKQRNLPYGVIQNVFVKQDLLDRLFGLASLRVEDASHGGESKSFMMSGYGRRREDVIGMSGGKVSIPGLKKSKAEELKNLILQKMKDNPVDTQSGL